MAKATKPANQAGKKKTMNPPPSRKPTEPSVTEILEKDFAEALSNILDKRLGVVSTEPHQVTALPEPPPKDEDEEDISTTALRKVVVNEISRLLATTQPLFDGLRDSPELAEAIALILFEEGGPLSGCLCLAEVLAADQPAEAIADLLEEVGGKIYELQLVAGALNPDYELERSAQLDLIKLDEVEKIRKAAEKEAACLNLQERLAEILAGDITLDTGMANLIEEGEQEAAAEKQRRAQFRQKLTHGLRERKQKEGRRFSAGSSGESGDEEFVKFLMENRGDLEAVRQNLPAYLREQVESLLRDEERKTPLLRRIAEIKIVAQRRWATLRDRLQAGADRPEETITANIRSILVLRDELAQIRELGIELKKLDEPEKVPVKPDYGTGSWVKTKNWPPNLALADAFHKLSA